MPEPPGAGARGQVFTTARFRIFGVKNLNFIGEFENRSRKNSQNLPPVSKVGLIRAMKPVSTQTEQRIALVLFPFKAYVAMAVPFLLICRGIQSVVVARSQFYGDPHAAEDMVLVGYAISAAILFPGALLQTLICRRGSAFSTYVFFVVGIVILMLFFPRYAYEIWPVSYR